MKDEQLNTEEELNDDDKDVNAVVDVHQLCEEHVNFHTHVK